MNIRLSQSPAEMQGRAADALVEHEAALLLLTMSCLTNARDRRDQGEPPLPMYGSHEKAIAKTDARLTEVFTRFLDAVAYVGHVTPGYACRVRAIATDAIQNARHDLIESAERTRLAERLVAELQTRADAHNAATTGPGPAPEHSPLDPGFGPTQRFQAWADDALVPDVTAEVPLSDVRDAWHADHPDDSPIDEVTIRKWMNGTLCPSAGVMGDKVTIPVDHHTDDGPPRRILKGYRLALCPSTTPAG